MPEEKGDKKILPQSSAPRKKERPLTPEEKLEILHAPAHQQAKIEAVEKRENRLTPKKTEPTKGVDELSKLRKENNSLKAKYKEMKFIAIVLSITLLLTVLLYGFLLYNFYRSWIGCIF